MDETQIKEVTREEFLATLVECFLDEEIGVLQERGTGISAAEMAGCEKRARTRAEKELTRDDREETDDAAKKIAHKLHGVSWVSRVQKYTAAITVGRKRIHLGYFVDPHAAAKAYADAKSAQTSVVKENEFSTLAACWTNFLETCARDEKGFIAIGEMFVAPDDQVFQLVGPKFLRKKGKKKSYTVLLEWEALCRVCGESYLSTTHASVKKLTGITRTCKKHRGMRKANIDLV